MRSALRGRRGQAKLDKGGCVNFILYSFGPNFEQGEGRGQKLRIFFGRHVINGSSLRGHT